MPIAALAPGVVVALGSAQVLTTPVSVVKELVDNALDAGAHAIFVDVSTNTLDCIQVKDDGRGIAAEDRDHVARRHCTSKIRDLQDLNTLGGTSLGFRGEALASAAEMAGRLEIMTRTEGEVTATKLTIGRQGEVASRQNASHAVGTTVRVSNFLQQLPVRKEAAGKQAAKNLQRIKELLQSYAMARPRVRFSLKILGAKNEKGNWSYVPRRNATMADAALAVMGKDAAAQCSLYEMAEDMSMITTMIGAVGGQDEEELPDRNEGHFKIEAFLPTPTADVSKISGKGQFVSIDSRPVSCAKGTLKEVVSHYKRYIRSAPGDKVTSTTLKDPFLCMNVACPRGSYDPNIEPAKDDVLFENPGRVVKIVEECFIEVYGEIKGQEAPPKDRSIARSARSNAFEKLLARKQPEEEQTTALEDGIRSSPQEVHTTPLEVEAEASPTEQRSSTQSPVPQSSSEAEAEEHSDGDDELFIREGSRPTQQHKWRPSMYGDDEDNDGYVMEEAPSSKTVASRQTEHPLLQLAKSPAAASTKASTRPTATIWKPSNGSEATQTPASSPLHPPRPLTPSFSTPHVPSLPFARLPTRVTNRGVEEVANPTDSDNNTLHLLSPSRTIQSSQVRPEPGHPSSDALESRFQVFGSKPNDFVSARSLPLTSLGDRDSLTISNSNYQNSTIQHRREQDIESMFTPSSGSGQTRSTNRRSSPTKRIINGGRNRDIRDILASMSPERTFDAALVDSRSTNNNEAFSSSSAVHPDVEHALDYERRKQIATRNQRVMLARLGDNPPSSSLPPEDTNDGQDGLSQGRSASGPTKSPHQSRYQAALAALRQPTLVLPEVAPSDGVVIPTMPEHDPRRYLIRMRSEKDKAKRIRTSKLPLETVPENLYLQCLSCKIHAPLAQIKKQTQLSSSTDKYIASGALPMPVFKEVSKDEPAMAELQEQTMRLVKRVFRTGDGVSSWPVLDVGSSLRDYGRIYP